MSVLCVLVCGVILVVSVLLCVIVLILCMMDGSCCRSIAIAALVSSGLARCEPVLHYYGTSPLEKEQWYQLVTVRTHGNFIVLPHWNMRPPAP